MTTDRLKKAHMQEEWVDTLPPTPMLPPALERSNGRYIRFSHRYNTWQVRKHTGSGWEWKNVSANIARCYAALGYPIGSQT